MLISPPPVSGADRISTLPDNVLQDILSLLTAQEAVRARPELAPPLEVHHEPAHPQSKYCMV
jgi:hypothetical protein